MTPNLHLPSGGVPARATLVRSFRPDERVTVAELPGPGCIRHLFCVLAHPGRTQLANRKMVLRITFDDAPTPHVEAPVGDFFGLMHGRDWYDINNQFLSAKAWSGMNCYFPMPFARSARIEFQTDREANQLYFMADWTRYDAAEMPESLRFCARWRRECPTQRYGRDYLVLDADGPGKLVGYAYGVRLMDNEDRWSHGGADNIYVDGQCDRPAYLRGIGGEDAFGSGYGGALHPPESHLYAAMPYYTHEDTGEARPAQRLGAYRFHVHDEIAFRRSLHVRFGCMSNDICSTAWWYQQPPVRPFFGLPQWEGRFPGEALPYGQCDLPLPDAGSWDVCGPFALTDAALAGELPAESEAPGDATYDAAHEAGSAWLSERSVAAGVDRARWCRLDAFAGGFIDLNHAFRPRVYGVGVTAPAVAVARAVLDAPADVTAAVRVAWDDRLVLRVNRGQPTDLGENRLFDVRAVHVPLRKGPNVVTLKLSNTAALSHGGWAVAFLATTPDGATLLPRAIH